MRLGDLRPTARAAWRSWGLRGAVRRAAYEARKRSGQLRHAERAGSPLAPLSALRLGIRAPTPDPPAAAPGVTLYGGLALAVPVPPPWHVHPLSGTELDASAHWSALSDNGLGGADVKDIWELSRLGWLLPDVRRWAATGDETIAEQVWLVVGSWVRENPPFLGPNWMCGQESSLRAITVLFLADALDASATTTHHRRQMVAFLVSRTVKRVSPSLGYALSQRNNHAISEAGFLWTAAALIPAMDPAGHLRRRAARALTEAVRDQFAADGSYAQHSPTYHRLALHVLLWCEFVGRRTGQAVPAAVRPAIERSVPHLSSLIAPGSNGRVPNLGGNDGALLFDLTDANRSDFRPVLAHAAAVADLDSGLPPGPWEAEARWFGLEPVRGGGLAHSAPGIAVHTLTVGSSHCVLRAGPLRHRPAHADQLHLDVWLDGDPIAVDAGSFRYTAPPPWGNALSGEEVHNVPRRAGAPQALRLGRFFWRSWVDARVLGSVDQERSRVIVARLDLPDGSCFQRLVAVADGAVVVLDEVGPAASVRWNLCRVQRRETTIGRSTLAGDGWELTVVHGSTGVIPVRSDLDPSSGWQSVTYGARAPLTPILVESDRRGRVVSCFTVTRRVPDTSRLLGCAEGITDLVSGASALARALGRSA